MLVFIAFSLLLLFAASPINSRLHKSFNASTLVNESYPGQLSSDVTSAVVKPHGNGVQIVGVGTVKLLRTNGALMVKTDINDKCLGQVQFCFSSTDNTGTKAYNTSFCMPGFCRFNIQSKKDDKVVLIDTKNYHNSFESPCSIQMGKGEISYCGVTDDSCQPLTDSNGEITINVTGMSYGCSVYLENVKLPPPPTTSLPSNTGSSKAKTAEASWPWYFWVILVVVILIGVAVIAGIIICGVKKIWLFKDSDDSKNAAFVNSQAPILAPKSITVKAEPEKSKVAAPVHREEKKRVKKAKKAAKKEKSLPTAREPTVEQPTTTMPSVTCDEITLPDALPLEESLKLPPPPHPNEFEKRRKQLKARALRRSKYNSIEEAKKRLQQ